MENERFAMMGLALATPRSTAAAVKVDDIEGILMLCLYMLAKDQSKEKHKGE
jgi:hypothetical protein